MPVVAQGPPEAVAAYAPQAELVAGCADVRIGSKGQRVAAIGKHVVCGGAGTAVGIRIRKGTLAAPRSAEFPLVIVFLRETSAD